MGGQGLNDAIAKAIFDPGLEVGMRHDRAMHVWQADAVMNVLDRALPTGNALGGERRDIGTAPRDGRIIFAIYEDDPAMDGPVMWSDSRACILGSRAGAHGPGWATAPECGTDVGLPVDEPSHWRPHAQGESEVRRLVAALEAIDAMPYYPEPVADAEASGLRARHNKALDIARAALQTAKEG